MRSGVVFFAGPHAEGQGGGFGLGRVGWCDFVVGVAVVLEIEGDIDCILFGGEMGRDVDFGVLESFFLQEFNEFLAGGVITWHVFVLNVSCGVLIYFYFTVW